MKKRESLYPEPVRVMSFADPHRERLFRLRNIRQSLVQSRIGFLVGLALYMAFAPLDYLIAPESLRLSVTLRLCVAPIAIAACWTLTFTHKSLLETWSQIVLGGTQVGHVLLALFGGIPATYFAVLTSVTVIFPLTFTTIRYRQALAYICACVPIFALVTLYGIRPGKEELALAYAMVGTFTLVGLIGAYSRERYIRQNFTKADELAAEKKKSERLLLNILPYPVAQELKSAGSSKPISYDGVTVLFADFVAFTSLTQGVPAEPVISTLDRYFSYFDFITRKYRLEKIKTIGDAYMLAGGLDTSIPTHAVDCVLAAFDFLDFVRRDAENPENGLAFNMRIGIHTGPVIAGVLGSLKFSYDIFGSTVNMASRMEKYSEANRINVSRTTHELIANFFECEPRGVREVKNGETYEMYFVKGIRQELCLDMEGNIPNSSFVELYKALESSGTAR